MIQITKEFKEKVITAILELRENYDGSDAAFAKTIGMNNSVFSRLKNGERDALMSGSQWLNLAVQVDVNPNERAWKIVKTEVFTAIEEEILFCKNYSKARIFVDDCGIGKTTTGKYLAKTLKNCFYIDASQAKTAHLFVRLFAKTIGVDSDGRLAEVKARIKYYLKMLPQPIIIIDEFGDLDFNAFLTIKEFWNATDGVCGWFMMGADGARERLEKGIRSKRVGFRETFSRFSESFSSVVPTDKHEKLTFYKTLITDVLSGNMDDKTQLPEILKRCITKDGAASIGGLRRAESLLILNKQ